jgi:cobalt/nickel transport system permease protein
MTDIARALGSFRLLDDLSRNRSPIHRTHATAKLLVTLVFVVTIATTSRREIVGLLPFVLYPTLIMALAELPVSAIAGRLLVALPLIVALGVLNPLFDREAVAVGDIAVAGGWLTFLSLLLKGCLTVAAAIILVATTGMSGVGEAMRTLGVPKPIVLQVQLTYRYLSLLLGELSRMIRAYELRSPRRARIGRAARGSFPGHLLVKSYARAQRVYDAMLLRGFDGEYRTGNTRAFRGRDAAYLASWLAYFLLVLFVDIPGLLGSLLLGAASR